MKTIFSSRIVLMFGHWQAITAAFLFLQILCFAQSTDTTCCQPIKPLAIPQNPLVNSVSRDTTYYPPYPDTFGIYQIEPKNSVVRPDTENRSVSIRTKSSISPPAGIPWWKWFFAFRDDRNVPLPTAPLWVEAGTEGLRQFDEDNTPQGYVQAAIGKRFFRRVPVDVYAKFKCSRDLSGVSWNNRGDLGAGIRLKPFQHLPVTFYAEAITGTYFNPQRASIRYNQAAQSMGPMLDSLQRLSSALENAGTLNDTLVNSLNAIVEGLQTVSNDVQREALFTQASSIIDSLYAQSAAVSSAGDGLGEMFEKMRTQVDSLQTLQDSLETLTAKELYNPTGSLSEYQAGIIFYYDWGCALDSVLPSTATFPFRWQAQLYSEIVYSYLQHSVGVPQFKSGIVDFHDSAVVESDLILYVNPKAGFVVAEGSPGRLLASAVGYAWIDTRHNWWYNKAMIGPALTYLPFREIDLAIEASYMIGGYYGIQRPESPNPYPLHIAAWRVSFMFYYAIGL